MWNTSKSRRVSCISPCPGMMGRRGGDREIYAIGTQRRPLVPEQYRVHPPDKRAAQHRRGAAHRFRGKLPGPGTGRRLFGRTRGNARDPRHRLVTTKYNPARTWTPENAVGIGGAYLCIYGMEGPGGYQFVGRTVQMWNRYRQTADFVDGKPWLLRFSIRSASIP